MKHCHTCRCHYNKDVTNAERKKRRALAQSLLGEAVGRTYRAKALWLSTRTGVPWETCRNYFRKNAMNPRPKVTVTVIEAPGEPPNAS